MAEQTPWLVELAPGERTMYVFPHGGAGAAAVAPLAEELRGLMRVVAVRLPGRESAVADPCLTDVELIAAGVAAQIKDDSGASAQPVLLYGHCAGAVIAYEVAALLDRVVPGHLVVSSHESPDRIPRPGVWTWPDDAFLARVADDGFLPHEVVADEELRELCLPPLRADYQAIETHDSVGDHLTWPVTALCPSGVTPVATEDLLSWSAFTSGRFECRSIEGPHHLLTAATQVLATELLMIARGMR